MSYTQEEISDKFYHYMKKWVYLLHDSPEAMKMLISSMHRYKKDGKICLTHHKEMKEIVVCSDSWLLAWHTYQSPPKWGIALHDEVGEMFDIMVDGGIPDIIWTDEQFDGIIDHINTLLGVMEL